MTYQSRSLGLKTINLRYILTASAILGCLLIGFLGGFMQSLGLSKRPWKSNSLPQTSLLSSLNWSRELQDQWGAPGSVPEYERSETDGRTFLIPPDSELMNMNPLQMNAIYWKYVNTVQILCRNQTRLGSFKDGGKEMCVDNEYLPRKPCLVYSFGSNFQFDFEEGVIGAFGCEVHTFDPSLDLSKAVKEGKYIPPNVHLHLKGLSGEDTVTSQNWHMRTLDTILRELNHTDRILDILKIDIEGGEWTSLPHMFKMGNLRRVKQMSIEVHFGRGASGKPWGDVGCMEQLKVLRELYNRGFRIFMREHNLWSLTKFKTEFNTEYTNVNEISLINANFKAH